MKTKLLGILVLSAVFSIMTASLSYGGGIKLMIPKFEKKMASKVEYTAKAPEIMAKYPKAILSKEDWGIEGSKEKRGYLETGLLEFLGTFETQRYKVDKIELWIEGAAESGGITKFFISLEAKGGLKVTLKPK